MGDPVLHVIVGPNGAGKTTLYAKVLEPVTRLDFVNADIIAAALWPDAAAEHSYEAAAIAADDRARRIAERSSFVTETVFSHESKLELLRTAVAAGYRVTLHVVLIPEDLAVARVATRVSVGGHHVPEQKIRERYGRIWTHVRDALAIVDEAIFYDNTKLADPYRRVAAYVQGKPIGTIAWPAWAPKELPG